ncbi:RNA polymerase sigma factor [Pseudooceanicola batsensis HTCC2597]|uniref:RNA polymerase sigma factor n=1 Tax=Pseudooceanicola batsensis (strain ATCC BAA-863 / DSM 15984 / KCTC 12145 / HTCC2597) TaxID=252305 RepID=A3U110_PSEBH|nr:flagellar hook-length control protein FliK [Pseudooceanicola batsensis]EAQ01993.1 RNA polymerase sigma factor [Pseudooceanicola batsensis HTCC2597]
MLGILNFGGFGQAQGVEARGSQQAAAEGAGPGFAALLSQVIAGAETPAAASDGKVTQLAALLGKFRAEAQESLSEVFPDGVIVPGEALNDWARTMLTRLDGMLQQAGVTVADLAQVLAPLEAPALEDADTLLIQAAQTLVTGTPRGTGPAEVATAPAPAPAPVRPEVGRTVSEGRGAAPAAPAPAGQGVPVVAGPTPAAPVTPVIGDGARDGTAPAPARKAGGAPNAASGVVEALSADPGTARTDMAALPQAAPLPDALRIILAQAVAAPADRTLPPEVQAILSAPQPTAAPLIASVAETAPPPTTAQPTPQQGLARNLAGQIRGVSFAEGTTRIELSPAGLGSIEIEIAPDEAGKLRVVLRAENPAVLNAMRSDREMLAGLLRDGGTSVEEGAMSFEDLGQRRNPGGQDPLGSTVTGPVIAEDDDEGGEIAAAPPAAGDGRLNILT